MSVIPHLHQRLGSCLLGLLLSGAALAQDPPAGITDDQRAVLAEGRELAGAVAPQDRLGVRRDRSHARTLRRVIERRQS